MILLTRRRLLAGATALGMTGLPPRCRRCASPRRRWRHPGALLLSLQDRDFRGDGGVGRAAAPGRPSDGVFAGVSKEDMTKDLTDNFLPTDNVALEQNALVINTGDRLVLFDTGVGASKVLGPTAGRLLSESQGRRHRPQGRGCRRADPCAPGSLLGPDGGGRHAQFSQRPDLHGAGRPRFLDRRRQARAPDDQGLHRRHAQAAAAQPRAHRVRRDGQEILPGIQAMAAPGHTVGHTIYAITSQGKTLCNVGDIAHHLMMATETAAARVHVRHRRQAGGGGRLRVFDMLAQSRTPHHLPFPLARHRPCRQQGDAFRYFPMPLRTVM